MPRSAAADVVARAWLSAVVLGIACGLAVLELGVIGAAILLVGVGVIAWLGPRGAVAAGVTSGVGLIWTALIGRVALTCGPSALFPDPDCGASDLSGWMAISIAILTLGVLGSFVALRRAR